MKYRTLLFASALLLMFPSCILSASAQTPEGMQLAAENERLALYYSESADIALENKENGYIWRSSSMQTLEHGEDDPCSSAVLTYGDRNSKSVSTMRSNPAAEVNLTQTENGIYVTYRFGRSGIEIPASYTLEEDHLSVSVDTSQIKEKQDHMTALELILLGGLGAAEQGEEGYFVIPDGCGALIRFDSIRASDQKYSAKVYDRDITAAPSVKPAVTEKVSLPVYGIVRGDNAMTVIAEQGSGNVTLNAGMQDGQCTCSFQFGLRGSDSYTMAGSEGSLTVFEDGKIKTDSIRVCYYPIAGEVSYADIAAVYRNYLLNDGGVQKKSADTSLYLHLYGGCMRTESVFGIPITRKAALTTYAQAQEIISGLTDSGVDNMTVIYHNWTDAGIAGKVDDKAKPSNILGNEADFSALKEKLTEQGISLYPAVNNKTFRSGNGYHSLSDSAVRISHTFSRQIPYSLSYGVQDTTRKTQALLSPSVFPELYKKLGTQYAEQELNGISLGEMTSTVWGDYGKVGMGRDDTIAVLQESYQALQDAGLSLLADGCAAYALPYTDRITNVPVQSSGFDIFDEEIPFYQLVLHGVFPYAGTPLNGNSTEEFLTGIAYGCSPSYNMMYAKASDLKDTTLDRLFNACYTDQTTKAVAQYQMTYAILSAVNDSLMTDYSRDGDVSVTTYADGTKVIVNYAEETVTVGKNTYCLSDFEEAEE